MADQTRLDIIKANPIGGGLDTFRKNFHSACDKQKVPPILRSLSRLGHDEIRNVVLDLLTALQILPVSRLLRSQSSRKPILSDLSSLTTAIISDDFDFDRIKPLLSEALAKDSDDIRIWDEAENIVAASTPSPRLVASSLQQTPWVRNTSSFANSSEYRQDVDKVLKIELGSLYVGLCDFHEAYFGCVPGLERVSGAVFERCLDGDSPLFDGGWSRWPQDANQDGVLNWFADISEKLAAFAAEITSPSHNRRPLAQPNKPVQGSTAERKLDVGFVSDPEAGKDSRCRWSQILVPGELKSNPAADIASKAWLDLGTYAREVLAARYTRRYVLGFTICGSLMRIWVYDRLGGVASDQFDINNDGPAWQYTERDEEGELLREATNKDVVNVARYYHHENVLVGSLVDDVCINVRRNLDVTRALNYRPGRSRPSSGSNTKLAIRQSRSSTSGLKRSSSLTGAPLPPSKRSCSVSPTKPAMCALANRVHRRVIIRDYGKPIYEASSRSALLTALEGCIEGHESLRDAGLLHRDISMNNLMMNEDDSNPSWSSFLIDLDLAVREQRKSSSGAKGKTGTRAFMAIGALLGEQHSFMHDLESFFCVLSTAARVRRAKSFRDSISGTMWILKSSQNSKRAKYQTKEIFGKLQERTSRHTVFPIVDAMG
ncbi:hypothetical protein JX266_013989 [Neoarthrinium moseri]|nr:hypothetical protein JX266_013989 [Neoarthrinium moseri]